jgi:hypothetical protein
MFAALQKKLVVLHSTLHQHTNFHKKKVDEQLPKLVLHSTLHQHTNFPKKSRRATSKTGFAFYTTPTYKLSKKK